MSEYKSTLNLPKTNFPMKANLAQREPNQVAQWQTQQIYQKIRNARKGQPKFIVHDGPIYANGEIHLGHALNRVLKDVIVKAKTLSGYDCPYVPGWDCHGLPIELNVEKKQGRVGEKISVNDFRQACRDFALKYVENQKQDFMRLGIVGDWDNPYLTLDHHYEANIIRSLAKMIERGHFEKGFKPVNWCFDCRSALAEAEIEYRDKKSNSIDVAFRVKDIAACCQRFKVNLSFNTLSFVIWTTTPWTLPANEAVAVHADIEYALVHYKVDGKTHGIIIAEPLCEQALARYEILDYEIVSRVKGEVLAGLVCAHPFLKKDSLVVLGMHVTLDAGTGCVHTAPGHGLDDFYLADEYHLNITQPVLPNGCFDDSIQWLAGQHVFKADAVIIEQCKTNKVLLSHNTIEHSYPHCWRHKSPTIFRATRQWFISMQQHGLRLKALSAIKEVQWLPEWGEKRMQLMLEGRPDWCISRQRAWCVPIPLVVHRQTGEPHPQAVAVMHRVADQVAEQGLSAWDAFDLSELGDDADQYEKLTDGLDVWFDSGVSHFAVLKQRPELQFPADLYVEGSDQFRGWFNSALITSIALNEQAPYKTVLMHGFTVDDKGHKMSKSLGNTIAPQKINNILGADILRLWVCSSDFHQEPALSDEILKRTSESYRRIRNTARYLLSNLHDFDVKQNSIKAHQFVALDHWLLQRAELLQSEIVDDYNHYRLHAVVQKIVHFCNLDCGSFYLDIIKDRQYTLAADAVARRSAQTAMYHVLQALVRWCAPILSFTAEEIYQTLPNKQHESVLLADWYEDWPEVKTEVALSQEDWQHVMQARDAVNKALENLRAQAVIGAGLEAQVDLYCGEALYQKLSQFGQELRFILITSQATVKLITDKTEHALATSLEDLFITVSASKYSKCERCWHRREDVESNSEHPTLCGRCVGNISDQPEERQYA